MHVVGSLRKPTRNGKNYWYNKIITIYSFINVCGPVKFTNSNTFNNVADTFRNPLEGNKT